MSGKWTEGPWTVIALTSEYVIKAGAKTITCMSWAARAGSPMYPTRTESEANARLIAAAPDLLAALEECAIYLDSRQDLNWEGTGPNTEMSLLWEVTEALAKVKP